MRLIVREDDSIPVSAITRLYIAKEYDEEDLRQVQRAQELTSLPDSWKQWLRERTKGRQA
jgi:hypothetical protein